MLYPGDPMFFPQPSTDDRKDFELNVSGNDLIVFKSSVLTVVSIAKKDLKEALDKIIESFFRHSSPKGGTEYINFFGGKSLL